MKSLTQVRTASAGRGWETASVNLIPKPLFRTSSIHLSAKTEGQPLLVPPHSSPITHPSHLTKEKDSLMSDILEEDREVVR